MLNVGIGMPLSSSWDGIVLNRDCHSTERLCGDIAFTSRAQTRSGYRQSAEKKNYSKANTKTSTAETSTTLNDSLSRFADRWSLRLTGPKVPGYSLYFKHQSAAGLLAPLALQRHPVTWLDTYRAGGKRVNSLVLLVSQA